MVSQGKHKICMDVNETSRVHRNIYEIPRFQKDDRSRGGGGMLEYQESMETTQGVIFRSIIYPGSITMIITPFNIPIIKMKIYLGSQT